MARCAWGSDGRVNPTGEGVQRLRRPGSGRCGAAQRVLYGLPCGAEAGRCACLLAGLREEGGCQFAIPFTMQFTTKDCPNVTSRRLSTSTAICGVSALTAIAHITGPAASMSRTR
jgi:hypothetical protein